LLNGKAPAITPRLRSHPDFPLRHFVRCGVCNRPLTGSKSKGRNSYYAYYHCQNSNCRSRVSSSEFEKLFADYLRQLQPAPVYIALFKQVVLSAWESRQVQANSLHDAADEKVRDLKQRKRKLDEAYVYQHSLDVSTYQEMKAALVEELAIAEMEEREARLEELNVEAVLNFAEYVLSNAANLWTRCSHDQKQRFQKVLFPQGLSFANGIYRTAETCLMFNQLEEESEEKEGLVAQLSANWNQVLSWLNCMETLRKAACIAPALLV
jgi:site-specific DNA recombinase